MPIYHPGLYCRACIHADPYVEDIKGACVHPLVPKALNGAGTGGRNDTECSHYRCKATCGTCRFYNTYQRVNPPKVDVHQCRRHAPTGAVNSFNFNTFPDAAPDSWCGEHEVKV